jgi:hypothetical protein
MSVRKKAGAVRMESNGDSVYDGGDEGAGKGGVSGAYGRNRLCR